MDEYLIRRVLNAARAASAADKLTLLDALTRLKPAYEAWHFQEERARRIADELVTVAESLPASEDAQAFHTAVVEVLAWIPAYAARDVRHIAEQFSDQRSPPTQRMRSLVKMQERLSPQDAVDRLATEFIRSPSSSLAWNLATRPLEDLSLGYETIEAGMQSGDEMTRIWTAIASARAGSRAGRYRDRTWLKPLADLWRSMMPYTEPPSRASQLWAMVPLVDFSPLPNLFPRLPQFFTENPALALHQFEELRPLPERLVREVTETWNYALERGLPMSIASRTLVAGLTGATGFLDDDHHELRKLPETEAIRSLPELPEESLALLKQIADDASAHTIEELSDQLRAVDPASRRFGVDFQLIRNFTRSQTRMADARPRLPTARQTALPRKPAQPPAKAPVSSPPLLHFVLAGAHASGNKVLKNTDAELIFRFDVPPGDALASVDDKALDAARLAGIDVDLLVTARGALTLTGQRRGRASFVNGRLTAPVAFPIRAGDAGTASSLHVDFAVRGESVHQIEMTVEVLGRRQTRNPPTAVDGWRVPAQPLLVTSASAPPAQRITLSLSFQLGQFCIELRDLRNGLTEFEKIFTSRMDATRLSVVQNDVSKALENCFSDGAWKWYDGHPPPGDTAAQATAALERTLTDVAEAGYLLHHLLCGDEQLAKALEYVEQHGQQGAMLTVMTDDIFLPWEILNAAPRSRNMTDDQKQKNPVKPERFWGARFAIETLQRGRASMSLLRRQHLESPSRVSVNFDPHIAVHGVEATRQPGAVHDAWATRLRAAGQLTGVQRDCESIRQVLQETPGDATLIYIYSHGNAAKPLVNGSVETLMLDANCPIRPIDLVTGEGYRNAPIVFLNSCEGAAFSPLSFSTFLRKFCERGALGMIGATFAIPIVFGARFAEQIADCCLQRRGSLAAAMLTLRRNRLLQDGNPVPLFYSLFCQIDFGERLQ